MLTVPQHLFLNFIKEREYAREAKEHGIHPHSEDPIIRDFKFCNINREHDRVTVWIKENIRENTLLQAFGPSCLVHYLTLARVFNHPPTLQTILDVKHETPGTLLQEMAKAVHVLKADGKVFRGAYKMPAHGKGGSGGSSVDYFFSGLREIWDMEFHECKTLESVAVKIQEARGFGPFLANQVTTDLRYTPFWKDAPDWETFVLCGPGTKKGLCRFFGLEPKKGGTQTRAAIQLREAKEILQPHLESPFNEYFRDPNNLTNSFCEFSKYARTLEGGAPPKNKYQPYQE